MGVTWIGSGKIGFSRVCVQGVFTRCTQKVATSQGGDLAEQVDGGVGSDKVYAGGLRGPKCGAQRFIPYVARKGQDQNFGCFTVFMCLGGSCFVGTKKAQVRHCRPKSGTLFGVQRAS